MKRFSFFLILLMNLLIMNAAFSEAHPLAADFSKVQSIFYLENGNILYSQYDGDSSTPDAYRTVSQILCVDPSGKQVWECNIPTFTYSGFSGLIQTNDGQFAYIGKKNEEWYSLLTLSQSGELLDEYTFSKKIDTPYLLSDGVVYLTAEEKRIQKRFWDGTIVSPESQKSFDRFEKAETFGNRTYVSAIADHENFLLCIDELGQEVWEIDLENANDVSVQAWCPSGNDSIVIAYQMGLPNPSTSFCLMEITNGEKNWETPLTWPNESIRMHLLLPNQENGYDLYGRLNDEKGFCLSFSQEGKVTTCFTVDVPTVDFVQYNGSVYAVGYDYDQTSKRVFPRILMDYELMPKQQFIEQLSTS